MLTIAPELPGALELIRRLSAQGIVASFGHSAADYVQTAAGLKAGLRHATHLFNAMSPLHHREPGPVPALLERREVTLQVIADGVHLHPAILRLLAGLVGPERVVLITDGLQALGLEDGSYTYNRQPIVVSGGTARSLDGTLVGTTLGMNRLIQRYQSFTGCALAAAVRAASFNPACVLGIQNRTGSLESGKSADLAAAQSRFHGLEDLEAGAADLRAGVKPLLLACGLPLRRDRPSSFQRQLELLAAAWRAAGREVRARRPADRGPGPGGGGHPAGVPGPVSRAGRPAARGAAVPVGPVLPPAGPARLRGGHRRAAHPGHGGLPAPGGGGAHRAGHPPRGGHGVLPPARRGAARAGPAGAGAGASASRWAPWGRTPTASASTWSCGPSPCCGPGCRRRSWSCTPTGW